MASKPGRVSNGWRTRWTYKNDFQFVVEEFEADCQRAADYVTKLGNKISMDDPLILGKAYLHGDDAAYATVKAGNTFGAAAQTYAELKSPIWAENRRRSFDGYLKNHFADWLDWPIIRITDAHLNAKYHQLQTKGWMTPAGQRRDYARNTLIAIMEVALQVINYSYDHGVFGDEPNPTKSRYLNFNRTMKPGRYRESFTLEEFSNIMALADPLDNRVPGTLLRDQAMILTMAVFGLRIGEVCALNCGECNLAAKTMTVDARILRGSGTNGRTAGRKSRDPDDKPAVLGFNDVYRDYIEPFVVGFPAGAPMFPGIRDGKHQHPDEWRSTKWRPILDKAVELGMVRENIDLVPHALKHSMVTWFQDHLTLAQLLARSDHKSERVNRTYRHRGDLEPERKAMDEIFSDGFGSRGRR